MDSGLPLFRVAGKKLGIIGYGRIGQSLAALAHAIGMEVLTDSRKEDLGIAQRCTREGLLSNSDFVSLHLPGTDDLRNLIGEPELALMKRTGS